MASLPYMQLYVSDYLADTAHLSAEQHGAYMLLLMNYWQKGKPLDNTNERLQHVARLSDKAWISNKEILAEFFLIEGDIWTHTRIEDDLSKVREKSVKASTAGKRSFSVRSTPVEQPFNHKDKDKDKELKTSSFDEFWSVYPRKVGKQDALKAFERALRLATAEEIVTGAQRYADDRNRLAEFTAHPATWLNRGSWSDEPLPNRASNADLRLEQKPTYVPPRFVAEERVEAVPMPDSVKQLFRKTISDL